MSNFLALLLFAPFIAAGLKARAARAAARPVAKAMFDDARKRAVADRNLDPIAKDLHGAWEGLFPPPGDSDED